MKKGRWADAFETKAIRDDIAAAFRMALKRAKNADDVVRAFDQPTDDLLWIPIVPPEDATGAAKLRAQVAAPSGMRVTTEAKPTGATP